MFTINHLSTISLLVASTLFSLPQQAKSQSNTKGIKNIVLVHGAFADGSSWSKVISLLQAKGYNVIAVQNPLTSLADDVAATRRAIAQMDGPVLLAAHSYGGMVISEAGNDPKVAGLLYVAALVPEEGQNANAVNAAMPTTGIEKKFKVSPEGFVSLSEKAVNENFVPDASAAEQKLVYATQVPLFGGAVEEKVQNPAWKSKPTWYIVAEHDGVINPDLEAYKAKLIKANTIKLESGHVPMITHPKRVADFIIGAAQELQNQQATAAATVPAS
jgi:pimeloyl-ACP methyl ester carboxylesterase